jgi:hypothetical protein
MAISTHRSVEDLPPAQRQTLESLLGHKLQIDEHIFILACTPGLPPDDVSRREARARIEATREQPDTLLFWAEQPDTLLFWAPYFSWQRA